MAVVLLLAACADDEPTRVACAPEWTAATTVCEAACAELPTTTIDCRVPDPESGGTVSATCLGTEVNGQPGCCSRSAEGVGVFVACVSEIDPNASVGCGADWPSPAPSGDCAAACRHPPAANLQLCEFSDGSAADCDVFDYFGHTGCCVRDNGVWFRECK